MTTSGGPARPDAFAVKLPGEAESGKTTELTWGELKAFAEAHGLEDGALLYTWDENHEADVPLVAASVSIFMNGRQELTIRS